MYIEQAVSVLHLYFNNSSFDELFTTKSEAVIKRMVHDSGLFNVIIDWSVVFGVYNQAARTR